MLGAPLSTCDLWAGFGSDVVSLFLTTDAAISAAHRRFLGCAGRSAARAQGLFSGCSQRSKTVTSTAAFSRGQGTPTYHDELVLAFEFYELIELNQDQWRQEGIRMLFKLVT